jgi:outer membrane lipoprotein-sorting protein
MISFVLLPHSGWAADVSPDSYYKDMIGKLKSLKTYQATVNETMVLQPTTPGARARTIQSASQVAYKGPNLFSLKYNGLMGGATMVSDGKQEIIYSDFTQEYVVSPSPADVVTSALSRFFGKTVAWTSADTTSLNGVAVRELHGKIESPRGATMVTLYIRRTDALPDEVLIVLPAATSATGSGVQITRTEVFADQKLNQPVDDGLFKFSPPDGATKVNSVSDLTSGMGGGGLQ